MNDDLRRVVAARANQIILFLLAVIALLMIWLISHLLSPSATASVSSPLISFLSQDENRSFAKVQPGYQLKFLDDHGGHPEFRQEWWYFTGNLQNQSGRDFGFQLTFFRFAGSKFDQLGENPWNSGQTWMAHFALTDIQANQFYAIDDFTRDAGALAGAEAFPFSVWVNSWSVRQSKLACAECFDAILKASTENFSVSLAVKSDQPPLLHGDYGYSVKNHDGSIASYYYSYPDLQTQGSIEINGSTYQVTGKTWMDREWSSTVLGEDQLGWDWFALHFDDGREMMLFQVRARTGEPYRTGVLINTDGSSSQFSGEMLSMSPGKFWRSRETGNRYPVEWLISGNSTDSKLRLVIKAAVRDQELNLGFSYYEGATVFSGNFNGQSVSGNGYMELTGYDEKP